MRAAPLFALIVSCSAAYPLHRFPLRAPMTRDVGDTRPVATRPAVYRSSDLWDFVDQSFLEGPERALLVPVEREADDVNALDEVPESSWIRAMPSAPDPATLQRGACAEVPELDPSEPWRVIETKPNGFNPGFVVLAADGSRYLFKGDGDRQPELTSAADAIGSRIYWALGYGVPCNRVVAFERAMLRFEPTVGHPAIATSTIERVLSLATRLADGRYRMGASRFIEGAPLGPFRYEGTRADDPNDVVPHEDRRELRAGQLVAAWLNHFDTREQNTFTSFVATGPGGRGYVRHWLLDFGDCFGAVWPLQGMTERSGFAYSVDFGEATADFLSLGLVRRPWDRVAVDPGAYTFGYFRSDPFDPVTWRSIEPNPAFERMTERDAAWIVRRIARLGPAQIHAIVAAGAFTHPAWSAYLERTLLARRARILARYLTRLSPLADATIERDALCATDLATQAAVRPPGAYTARMHSGARLERTTQLAVVVAPDARVCAHLATHIAPDGGPPDDAASRYLVVDLVGAARGSAPLRVHGYDLGPTRGYQLVGLERPATDHWPP